MAEMCVYLTDFPQEDVLLSGAADPEAQTPHQRPQHQRDPR